MDKISKLTRDDLFMSEAEAIEWALWEEKSKMTEARKQGLEQGLEQGIEQNTIKTIKNMIEKNISIEDISDITGKSIEEINKIIN